MPTARPRHMVTETDDVARALDDAARRWPGEPRSRLLRHLITEGQAAIRAQQATAVEERRRRIRQATGSLGDIYPPGYLEDLRRDWPA